MRLLLHDYQLPGQVSPFADALTKVAQTGQLFVACPFIGLNVLDNALARIDRFKIVTDLEAWLTIVPGAQARFTLIEWWKARRHAVRHQSMLHAKVFIGRGVAVVGSANCTDTGFSRRVEAGVFIDEAPAVAELTAWFERTWQMATELDDASLVATIAAAPAAPVAQPSSAARTTLLANPPPRVGPRPQARRAASETLLPITTEDGDPGLDVATATRVAGCLRHYCDRAWAVAYFDWLGNLIRAVSMAEGNPQLTTTLVDHDRRIGVNINNRSSLAWDKRAVADRRAVYYLLPSAYAETLAARVPQRVDRICRLHAYRGEQTPPVLLIADFPPPADFGPEFRDTLFGAARAEIARARLHSPQGGRRHVPLLFNMALDRSLCDEVLDLAFSASETNV